MWVRWKEDVQTVMHSWPHVHLMKLCMCWAGCRVFVYMWFYQTHFVCDVIRLLEHFYCVCDRVCSPQKCMFRIFVHVCVSTSLCICAVVFLNSHVAECWVIDRSCHAGIWEFAEKQKHLFCQELCMPHTHRMKYWNGTNILISYTNLIFSSAWLLVSNVCEVWCLTQIL